MSLAWTLPQILHFVLLLILLLWIPQMILPQTTLPQMTLLLIIHQKHLLLKLLTLFVTQPRKFQLIVQDHPLQQKDFLLLQQNHFL